MQRSLGVNVIRLQDPKVAYEQFQAQNIGLEIINLYLIFLFYSKFSKFACNQ